MLIRCQCCGASQSLDAAICGDEAHRAIAALSALDSALFNPVLRYLGLFRPAKTKLTFTRTAVLLDELLPKMQAERVDYDGQTYPAPPAAWVWAIEQVLAARDRQDLGTPLKNHRYLYKVITSYRPPRIASPVPTGLPPSKTLDGIASLEGLKK